MTRTKLNDGSGKAARLSDVALVLLSHAADREGGMVLPPAASVRARGGALDKALSKLLRQGFVEEVGVANAEQAWRAEADGARIGLRITGAGLEAIGVGGEAEASAANAPDGTSVGFEDEQETGSQAACVAESGGEELSSPPYDDKQAGAYRPLNVRPGSKQNLLVEQLGRDSGVTISELTRMLGWLPHTVRAAITGLRRKGFEVTRTKNERGETVYRASLPAEATQSDPASLS